jgi:hypothetical protein
LIGLGGRIRHQYQWWRIPADTVLPDTIRVVQDQRDPFTLITHYSPRPAR